jgi:ankyrin repeat/BTB/POZ domain-containing protein 1
LFLFLVLIYFSSHLLAFSHEISKRGDIEAVSYLLQVKGLNINRRDKWSSTPLYYAALCNHIDLVKFLLSKGARCEEGTFDGERCLYAAHSPEIKQVLLQYKVTPVFNPFREFLRTLHSNSDASADIIFRVGEVDIPAHRFVLAARSIYFAEQLQTRWLAKRSVRLSRSHVLPLALQAVIRWLYTEQLELPAVLVPLAEKLARQARLPTLERLLRTFNESPAASRPEYLILEPNNALKESVLSNDMRRLAMQGVPHHLWSPQFAEEVARGDYKLPAVDPFCATTPSELVRSYWNVVFDVDGDRFFVHSSVFVQQSDYFRTLLTGHFAEAREFLRQSSTDAHSLPLVRLNLLGELEQTTQAANGKDEGMQSDSGEQEDAVVAVSASSLVFRHVLEYLYAGSVRDWNHEVLLETLYCADRFLLNGLKNQVAAVLCRNVGK